MLFNSSARVGITVRIMIRFSVWLASGYALVLVLVTVVTVTLPVRLL